MPTKPYISKIKPDGSTVYYFKDSDGRDIVAANYATGVAYTKGDYVLYTPTDGTQTRLYKISANITAGANTGWSVVSKAATTVADELKGLANDSSVVHIAGDETITGNKTFSSEVSVAGNLNIRAPGSTSNAASLYIKNEEVGVTILPSLLLSAGGIVFGTPHLFNDSNEHILLPENIPDSYTIPDRTLALQKDVDNGVTQAMEYADDLISGLGTIMRFKGTKATVEQLRAITSAKAGDVYIVTADNSEWVCKQDISTATASAWEKFGTTDVSGAVYKGSNTFTNNYFIVADGTDGKAKAIQKASGSISSLTVSGTAAAQAFTGTEKDVSVSGTVTKALGTVTKKAISATASGTALSTTANTAVNKGYTPTKKGFAKTNITPLGTGQSITYGNANVGSAVVYGKANVGAEVTYGNANVASSQTTVGNANVGTAVVYGKANVGTAVTYGTANKAASATTVGNANVGTAVTYGKANVGTAVVYGTADVGTAVAVGTALGGTTSFNTDAIKTATLTGTTSFLTTALKTATLVVDADDAECLKFTTSNTSNSDKGTVGINTTAASKASVTLTTNNITPAVAAPSTQTLTPAVASNTTLTPAVASSTTIYGAVDSTLSLTPAVAAPNTQTLTPASESSTKIYGAVASTTKLTPAVAAPNTQTLTPAATSSSSVTVYGPGTALDVVTGINTTGTGTDVVTDIASTGTITPLTAASVSTQPTITISLGTTGTGTIDVVTNVAATSETVTSSGKFTPEGSNTASNVSASASNIAVEVTPKVS